MIRLVAVVVLVVAGLAELTSAGPAIVATAHALVPLVVAIGVVAIVARLVWYWTNRW